MSTPQTLDFNFDIRALAYLTRIDENLCCPICHSPLVEPTTTKCRHTFCSECILDALRVSRTCPVDRRSLEPEELTMAPVLITNLVNDLVVLCPNSNFGCTGNMPRSLVGSHLREDCQFVSVNCSVCNEIILRRDARAECMHKEIECSHCSKVVRMLDLKDHESRCPKLSSTCNHCAIELPRSDIIEHGSVCDEATMLCSSSSVGCPWIGRRKDSTEHSESCAFTHLYPLLKDHSDRIAALELENKALKAKIEMSYLLRNNAPRSEDSTSTTSLDEQTLQIMAEQEHLRTNLERLYRSMAEMKINQNMLTMYMSESMRTKEDVAMIGVAVNNLRSQLNGLQMLAMRRQNLDQCPAGNNLTGPSTSINRHSAVDGTGGSMLRAHTRNLSEDLSGGDRVKL